MPIEVNQFHTGADLGGGGGGLWVLKHPSLSKGAKNWVQNITLWYLLWFENLFLILCPLFHGTSSTIANIDQPWQLGIDREVVKMFWALESLETSFLLPSQPQFTLLWITPKFKVQVLLIS